MVTKNPDNGHLTPTEFYLTLQEEIKAALTQKIKIKPYRSLKPRKLTFFTPNKPIAIVPENADRVMEQLCPDVDFTVVVMGKNVYRSLFINPDADILPHKHLIYLDVDDVRYKMADEEIDALAKAIQSFTFQN